MNSRWVARGLVAGLHLALLAALWWHRPAPLGDPGERRMTTVRLIQPPTPRMPLPAGIPAMPQPLAPTLPNIAPLPFTADAAPMPATPLPPSATTAVPADSPRATLRLVLPPGYAASSAAARNPALSDPRSNTVRPALEDRIADAAGNTGGWVSERTSDHRTLMRRGDTCMEVLRSRIADTDPFNSNVAPRTVPMFGKPYKCK